nr:MAG TPA: hypothetical protein [Caudoviricetes sp.]
MNRLLYYPIRGSRVVFCLCKYQLQAHRASYIEFTG